ncbi:hypothetical protein D3C72_1153570 [compost metagenome]
MHAKAIEIGRKTGLLASDAVVANQCQAQASTDGGTLYHDDQWLGRAEQAHGVFVQLTRTDFFTGLRQSTEVSTCAKRLSFGLQDNDAAGRQVVQILQCGEQIHDQFLIEKVQRRTAEFERGDVSLQFKGQATAGSEGGEGGHQILRMGRENRLDRWRLIPLQEC